MADSCNYPVFRDEQMALVTEMEKAVAEMKAQKAHPNSTPEYQANLINKLTCKHKPQIKQRQRQYTEEEAASK